MKNLALAKKRERYKKLGICIVCRKQSYKHILCDRCKRKQYKYQNEWRKRNIEKSREYQRLYQRKRRKRLGVDLEIYCRMLERRIPKKRCNPPTQYTRKFCLGCRHPLMYKVTGRDRIVNKDEVSNSK